MEALLELGAGVAEVEALLADCVVAVEADEQDAAGRVDGLPGLSGGGRDINKFNTNQAISNRIK